MAFRCRRLRSALAWFEGTPGQSLDGSEKAIISEQPAKPFGGAQAAQQVRLRIAGKPIGEVKGSAP